MKVTTIINSFLIALLVAGCTSKPSKKALKEKIKTLKTEVYQGQNADTIRAKAKILIDRYKSFTNNYPKDTLAPVYLYEAGQTAKNILQDHRKAVENYDKLVDQYPDHEQAPVALFTMGFMYENEINDTAKARNNYKAFLEQYPEHDLAQDARTSLKYLGKSAEEMLDEIMKQKQDTSVKDTVS